MPYRGNIMKSDPMTPRPAALAFAVAAAFAAPAFAQETLQQLEKVEVKERAPQDDARPKLNFIMKEVDGPVITVTKKTSITKLDRIPTVVDNNMRGLFAQTPGLYVSEQQTPGQYNFSYRGIGNPQESEFVTVLQDGIPLESDWIGYPTIYLFPLPQTIEQVQLIRGGSSLLYGPEPPPVINLISRKPVADREFAGYSENVVGSNGLFATFNKVSGTVGEWDYLIDAHYRTNDGQRVNGDSEVQGADLHVGYRPDAGQYWAADLRAYQVETGDPGRYSYTDFVNNPDKSPTPYNRLWSDRYVLSVSHERKFDDLNQLVAKVWTGYQDLSSRSAGANVVPGPTASTQLQDDQFRFYGVDARYLHRWGRGNAFTLGTTLYHSDAPFRQWTSNNLEVDRYTRYSDVCVATSTRNCARLDHERSTDYYAVFAENVFRWGEWHLVPSIRLEHERVDINERIKPPNLLRPIVDQSVRHTVPLLGLGFGNDFGHMNETYFNVSQGWRPVRYFDVGSPFGNTDPTFNNPDPTHTLSYEAGVHGTPVAGLFYDASLFWVNVTDRIESKPIDNSNNTINVNTGDTRHRGFEGQIEYDFLTAHDPSSRQHLALFANLTLQNSEFTASRDATRVGKKPAFSPDYLARAGITFREDGHYKLALSAVSVDSQYYQDSNAGNGQPGAANYVPAQVPSYTIVDFSGDWTVAEHVRLLGGVSNLTDRKYYARVWSNSIEPGLSRTWYVGASYEF